jgi:hypothetical protein
VHTCGRYDAAVATQSPAVRALVAQSFAYSSFVHSYQGHKVHVHTEHWSVITMITTSKVQTLDEESKPELTPVLLKSFLPHHAHCTLKRTSC